MQTFADFAAAKAAADKTEGSVVSGVWKDDEMAEFVYFLAPAEADNERMWDLSYEARYDEPMRPEDRQYLRQLAREAKAMA